MESGRQRGYHSVRDPIIAFDGLAVSGDQSDVAFPFLFSEIALDVDLPIHSETVCAADGFPPSPEIEGGYECVPSRQVCD
jgi:hypothetical protein